MPKIDLLPCPFCGNAETLKMQTVPSEYRVLCDTVYGGCGASTGWNHRTPEEAAKAWNTRASGWIPCSERMPEPTPYDDEDEDEDALIPGDNSNRVLVMLTNGYITSATWYKDEEGSTWITEIGEDMPEKCITHWMPLPPKDGLKMEDES